MCKTHGWKAEVCPDCLLEKAPVENAIPALRAAFRIIDARPEQRRLMAIIAENSSLKEALGMARAWQNPLPLPVVICNF